jgi:hypothetical protein
MPREEDDPLPRLAAFADIFMDRDTAAIWHAGISAAWHGMVMARAVAWSWIEIMLRYA